MKYLGIDYGAKKIGIAISDASGEFAFPKAIIANNDNALQIINSIASEEKVDCIVIGNGSSMSGEQNKISSDIINFIKKLQAKTGLSVHVSDESYSSAEAMRFAPSGKRHDDSSAAAIILQRYLDSAVRLR